jgi:nucleotide-binding universal stress UspA family protein
MTRALAFPGARSSSSADATAIAVRRILWACDFTPSSTRALQLVIPIAQAYGSVITALHVLPATVPPSDGPESMTSPALGLSHLRHDAALFLDRHVAPAVVASVPTRITLREGDPADQILDFAARLPADLIALGTHRQTAFEPPAPGAVADAILGGARCPVLAVPVGAVVPSGARFKTVLWATDFSTHAGAALRYALSLAVRSHARLLLLHVVDGATFNTLVETERVRESAERLQEAISAGQAAGCEVEAIVTSGSASVEILRIAGDRAAELIVMGVHGSRALHTALFGSTAHRVVGDAPCAVLAVRRR